MLNPRSSSRREFNIFLLFLFLLLLITFNYCLSVSLPSQLLFPEKRRERESGLSSRSHSSKIVVGKPLKYHPFIGHHLVSCSHLTSPHLAHSLFLLRYCSTLSVMILDPSLSTPPSFPFLLSLSRDGNHHRSSLAVY